NRPSDPGCVLREPLAARERGVVGVARARSAEPALPTFGSCPVANGLKSRAQPVDKAVMRPLGLRLRLGLTQRFLLLSGVSLLVLGVCAYSVLSHLLRARAFAEAKATATLIARVGVQSHISASQLTWGMSHSNERLL